MPAEPETGPRSRVLLSRLRPFAGSLAALSALTLLDSGISLATPKLAGMVVDSALEQPLTGNLDYLALALVGLFAVRGVLAFFRIYLRDATSARILRALRSGLFERLIFLHPSFFENRRTGELLSRMSDDIVRVQNTLAWRIPEGAHALVVFVGTVIILFATSVSLASLTLLTIPAVTALALIYGRRLEQISKEIQDTAGSASGDAEEAIAGVRSVQASGAEALELERYDGRLRHLVRAQLHRARLGGLFGGLLMFVGYSVFALVLYFGARQIRDGELSPGDLTAFLLYTFAVAGSISSLGSLYVALRELRGAAARMVEIFETESEVPDAASPEPFAARGAISLENVSFTYPSGASPAINGLSLDIEPGEVLALVGASGAGKSTTFSLLLRFYDPDVGSIRFDRRELRTIAKPDLRRSIAWVPQDIFLFSGSVADNIHYGIPGASDPDAVVEAARAAGADSFIRDLPEGYQAQVGERGIKLSAGQRQRIALARALYRQPSILLLDEATSALDADSEQLVQDTLRALRGKVTIVLIAHRLATASLAERIAVLENGQLAAIGNHAELMDRSTTYQRFWSLQSLERTPSDPT